MKEKSRFDKQLKGTFYCTPQKTVHFTTHQSFPLLKLFKIHLTNCALFGITTRKHQNSKIHYCSGTTHKNTNKQDKKSCTHQYFSFLKLQLSVKNQVIQWLHGMASKFSSSKEIFNNKFLKATIFKKNQDPESFMYTYI